MEFFNPNKLHYKFSEHFKVFRIVSVVLLVLSIVALIKPGLNYGIDFRGGIEAHISFKESQDIGELRSVLAPHLDNLSIVSFGETGNREFLLTAQSDDEESLSTALSTQLSESFGSMQEGVWSIERMDVVGARVGANLRKGALLSIIYTCLLITLYMWWRFDLRFSPGALGCIFHDLIIVAGFLAVLGVEFSTTLVAALLTLAGYSVNDTVVVYDRIREIESKFMGRDKVAVVDKAVNSTLSRTIMTAGTTLISCGVLFFVGGPTLRDFALTLFVGVIVGTYSSIYVASPIYIWADKRFGKQVLEQQRQAAARREQSPNRV